MYIYIYSNCFVYIYTHIHIYIYIYVCLFFVLYTPGPRGVPSALAAGRRPGRNPVVREVQKSVSGSGLRV